MTDETPQAVTETETPEAAVTQGDPADEVLREPGKKALDSERAARAAAEKALADLRKEIEDSKKTAEQKASEDLEAARKAAEESAAKALRYEVAAAKGLDLKLAARLSGSSREDLEADADALMELFPKADPAKPEPAPSVPTVGKTPTASGNVPLKDQIAAAEAAGEKSLVARLKAMQLGQAN